MDSVYGYIHSYESFGAVDGPGVRFVVFFQGCPLRCLYCHNPDTWEMKRGRLIEASAVLNEILQYRSFIKDGGVTLSGGEPLLQPDFCAELLSLCKRAGLHTAVDTSGAVPLSHCRKAVDLADLLLLDIKDIDPEDCIKLTGQDNRSALHLLSYCEETGKPVWIRHVLVPGLTADDRKLARLAQALKPFSCIQKVELHPFHKMGEYKWGQIGAPYTLTDTPPLAEDELNHAKELLGSYEIPS